MHIHIYTYLNRLKVLPLSATCAEQMTLIVVLGFLLYANKVSVNVDKTYYIVFASKPNKGNIKLEKNGQAVKRKTYGEFLGVPIYETVSLNEHCIGCRLKLSSAQYVIKAAQIVLLISTLKMLYYSLFYPHLTYGIFLWDSNYQSHLKSIITSQKKNCKSTFQYRQISTHI